MEEERKIAGGRGLLILEDRVVDGLDGSLITAGTEGSGDDGGESRRQRSHGRGRRRQPRDPLGIGAELGWATGRRD
jgi:hypothetical protein